MSSSDAPMKNQTPSSDTSKQNLSVQAISTGRSNIAWVWVLCAVLVFGLIYTTVQMRKAQDALGSAQQTAAAATKELAGAKAITIKAKSDLGAAEKKVAGLTETLGRLEARLSELSDKAVNHGKVAAAKVEALTKAIDELKATLGKAITTRSEKANALGQALEAMTQAKDGLAKALDAHERAQSDLQAATTGNARAEADVKVLKRALQQTTERLKAAEARAEAFREEAARFASQ